MSDSETLVAVDMIPFLTLPYWWYIYIYIFVFQLLLSIIWSMTTSKLSQRSYHMSLCLYVMRPGLWFWCIWLCSCFFFLKLKGCSKKRDIFYSDKELIPSSCASSEMGNACCVAASANSSSATDTERRRHSPTWSFRWDNNRGRVAGEVSSSLTCFSDAITRNNDASQLKFESPFLSSPLDSFRTHTSSQKSPAAGNKSFQLVKMAWWAEIYMWWVDRICLFASYASVFDHNSLLHEFLWQIYLFQLILPCIHSSSR